MHRSLNFRTGPINFCGEQCDIPSPLRHVSGAPGVNLVNIRIEMRINIQMIQRQTAPDFYVAASNKLNAFYYQYLE